MSVFRGHEVHRVASNATLTFEHTYTWWGESRPCTGSPAAGSQSVWQTHSKQLASS